VSHNRFQFIGNLTRDADLRQIENATNCRATINLAVNRPKRPGDTPSVDYFRIKCFNALAENAAKYLGKGSEVFIEGRIEQTKYQKDADTKLEYGIDFIAEKIEYLNTKKPAASQ